MTIPRATYRFQFHKDFTFADAEALVPYLAGLGISHLYASPITVARSGSTHGYDVVDPTRINPELGGEAGFRSLAAALRARSMGVIIDIVPNHMGIAGGENDWWQDVLRHGEASAFARYFDIDWREKLVLPVLGAPLDEVIEAGDLAIARDDGRFAMTAYGEHVFPLRDADQAGLDDIDPRTAGGKAGLRALHDRQHYRLASWRVANDVLNWRRFFTVNDLAALRVEEAAVFEATHALYFRLYAEGLIDGVRVDHVDGLTDPTGYCRRLRARLDALPRPADAPQGRAWIVVEKILGAGEALATDWGIDGTSGYDFMDAVAALLHDPAGEAPLAGLWAAMSGRSARFEDEELRARQDMVSTQFRGQADRCAAAFAALAASAGLDMTEPALRQAIERLLWVFPVYRTYGDGLSAPAADRPIRDHVRARVEPFLPSGDGTAIDRILSWLAGEGPGDAALAAEAVRRFQQLSAPIAAKSVEDTAFYRYGRLLSRTDVGFDAGTFASSIADFHRAAIDRAAHWPQAMLTTATHDHKRGEDVRARLAVLSDIPDRWRMRVDCWWHITLPHLDGIDRGDAYMLFQTIFGSFPEDLGDLSAAGLRRFAGRIRGWQIKALREARLRSSWEEPDADYEGRLLVLIDMMFDARQSSVFLRDLIDFVGFVAPAARANMLVQTGLRYTIPGIPDLYQGTELADLSLVDPDNRRPVDYHERQRLLHGVARDGAVADRAKIALIAGLLDLRRRHEALFARGAYVPIATAGPRADHVLAFVRQDGEDRLLCAFTIGCGAAIVGTADMVPDRDWWGDTRLDAEGCDLLAADMFESQPLLVRPVRGRTVPASRFGEPSFRRSGRDPEA